MTREEIIAKMNALVSKYVGHATEKSPEVAELILKHLAEGDTPELAVLKAFDATGLAAANTRIMSALAGDAFVLGFMAAAPAGGLMIVGPPLTERWKQISHPLSMRLYEGDVKLQSTVRNAIAEVMEQKGTWTRTAKAIYDGYGFGGTLPQAQLPQYLDDLQGHARRMIGESDPEAYQEFRRHVAQVRRRVDRLAEGGAPNRNLRAAYRQLVEASEKMSEKAMDKAVRVAVEERTRYHAERIARTELADARQRGFAEVVRGDDTITKLKWNLSSRHPRFDICDMNHMANFYGLGAGIYPVNSFPPLPAHPHCMCFATPIRTYETAESRAFDASAGDRLIRRLPAADRRALLGVKGSEKYQKGFRTWTQVARGYQPHAALPL